MDRKLVSGGSRSIILALSILSTALSQSVNYTLDTFAGIGNGDAGPAAASSLAAPQGLAMDAAGSLYIADPSANCVRKVTSDGAITTFAGTRKGGFSGDGGPVIGSTTAGANGDVSTIPLAEDCLSAISGLGVFYLDKRPTQRIGIIPDIEFKATIAGIRAGRDELIEEAIRQIRVSSGFGIRISIYSGFSCKLR